MVRDITDSTRKVYAIAWRRYCAWCEEFARIPLPASSDDVLAYVEHRCAHGRNRVTGALISPQQVTTEACAIQRYCTDAGHASPLADGRTHALLAEARRQRQNARQAAKHRILTEDELLAMVRATPGTVAGRRDRAYLLLSFYAAADPTTLIRLQRVQVTIDAFGAQIVLADRKLVLPLRKDPICCPARALEVWLEILRGRKLRCPAVFRRMSVAGIPLDVPMRFSAPHALTKLAATRAGFPAKGIDAYSVCRGCDVIATKLQAQETIA